MIGIVDYGMGNLGSVLNAFRFLGLPAEVHERPDRLPQCRAVVLPGVGAFGDCRKHLDERGFTGPLLEWIRADRPFLGICVGMQLLFECSEESPDTPGLAVLPGVVKKFAPTSDCKVPQMGWNRVQPQRPECPLFREMNAGPYLYFVHSFYCEARQPEDIAGETEYGGVRYASAVWRGRMMGVQFHPEKSQAAGLNMLRQFGAWAQGPEGGEA